jgi:hypothetical protein
MPAPAEASGIDDADLLLLLFFFSRSGRGPESLRPSTAAAGENGRIAAADAEAAVVGPAMVASAERHTAGVTKGVRRRLTVDRSEATAAR